MEFRFKLRSKAYALAVVVAFAAVMHSCSQPVQEPEPQAALAGYLDALVSGNSEEAAKYLAAQAPAPDAKLKEPGSFEAKMVRRALASYVSYDIAVVQRSDAKARLAAKIKSPDFQKIAGEIAARLAAAKFPAGGIEALDFTTDIVNSQVRVYKDQGIPMTSTLRNYELVKEGGGWKITGWD